MQFAPLVLDDGVTTTTYNPKGIDANGVASFVKSTGVPIADKRISVSRSRSATTGREKVAIKMTFPVVNVVTTNGVDQASVLRTAYADITMTFDKASTTLERAEIRNQLYALMGNPTGAAVIDQLDTLY